MTTAERIASITAGLRAASSAAGGGIYLGLGERGWAWTGAEHSTLVLGRTRSGKTSSVIVPNVLAASGPVVSTSTKADVMSQTAAARQSAGWCLLFDPSGTVDPPPGVHRVGWSPVISAGTWDGALAVADAMVKAARHRRSAEAGPAADHHWTERSTALLGPLLHAAALGHEPMRTVLHWVDRHDGSPALDTLAKLCGEEAVATDLLDGILATDSREQSGIWSTASGILAAYRRTAALTSTEPPYLDADVFCDGAHTLYVCAAGTEQGLFAPLIVGMLSDIRDAAYRRAANGVVRPPVLLALDEVANIAPLPDLPSIVSEGGGQGLLTLACLQDLSQARARWGQEGDAFFSLFGSAVVMNGIADMATLEALSALGGDREMTTRSVGWTHGSGRQQVSATDSTIWRRRLPVDAISRGVDGWALALDARNRMGWVRLTPAYATPPWRELVRSDRAHERSRPAEPAMARRGPAGRDRPVRQALSQPLSQPLGRGR